MENIDKVIERCRERLDRGEIGGDQTERDMEALLAEIADLKQRLLAADKRNEDAVRDAERMNGIVAGLAEQIADALLLGCEDGEYYIPADPEPIIVSDSIVEACKAFKAHTDKWATQDAKRIAELEAKLAAMGGPVTIEELAWAREQGWAGSGSLLQLGGYNAIIAARSGK